MTKRKRQHEGTCAYCAQSGVRTEVEHVFPESWYPDSYPREAMLTVPSCRRCNAEYGRVEERMFLPLVASLPEDDAAMWTIVERALRGVDPSAGIGVQDVAHRAARRRSILRRMQVLTTGPDAETVWSARTPVVEPMTTVGGLRVRGVPSVRFRPDDLHVLGVKFLRGCYFHVRGAPLPRSAKCNAGTYSVNPRETLRHAAAHLHLNFGGRPPFRFAFARATEDDTVTLWFFELWEHYVMHASSDGRLDFVSDRASTDDLATTPLAHR